MKKNPWLRKTVLAAGAAFAVFLLLLAVTAAAVGFVSARRSGGAEDAVTDWKFFWADQKETLEADGDTVWKIANARHPVQKSLNELFAARYIRLQTALPASAGPQTLELVTGNHPLRVCLDGGEVWNNGYNEGTALYVGNRVNTVSIPASAEETTVDLYLRVPLSFSLEVRLVSAGRLITGDSLINQLGLVGSLSLLAVSLLMTAVLFLFSLRNRRLSTAVMLSLLLLLSGGGALLAEVSLHTAALTGSWLYKIPLTIRMLTTVGAAGIAISAVDGWRALERITVGALAGYTAAFFLLPEGVGVWLLVFFPLPLLFMTMVTVLRITDALREETSCAGLVEFGFLSALFCALYDLLNLLVGWNSRRADLWIFGLLLFGALLFYILIRQSIDRNIRQAERKAQMEKDARWVNETITGCAGVFTQETLTGFCTEAVQTVRNLVLFDREDRSGSRPLRIGAAVRSDAGWEEFFRENLTEDCRYDTIVRRAAAHPGEGVFPGRHSVDMTFCNAEDPLCVIHVEGVGNGLSPDLDNVLRIAHQCIAMALDNLTLKKGLAQTQENVFLTLAEIVEQKSAGTGRHLRDVAEMVAVLAGELGIPPHEARIISSASMMHDIGKLAIPESIVSKQGQLTDDEYAIMQDHVIYGYNMLSKSPGDFMKAAAVIAQQHHEKYDGTGYLELKGEQIHLYARIVALADVLDALLSKRPYKDAWTPESAFEYIDGESGRHFDPRVVQAFDRCRDRLLAVKRQAG